MQTLRESVNATGLEAAAGVQDWRVIVPDTAKASGGTLSVASDGRIRASGTLPIKVVYTLSAPAISGLTALRVDIHPDSEDAKGLPERGQAFSKLKLSLVVPGEGVTNQPVALQEVIADHLAGPFDPFGIIDSAGGGFGDYPVMTTSRRIVVVLAQPLNAPADAKLEVTLEHGIASNSGIQGCVLRNFTLSASTDARLATFAGTLERRQGWSSLQTLKDQLKEVPGTRVPVLMERPQPALRETRVFIRGNRAMRDERVQAGIPEVVLPPKADHSLTRLDMARWLVGDRNPLAARVLANRLWAELMGRGIVETLEDFGTSGARPTHPELLDYLALRLRG